MIRKLRWKFVAINMLFVTTVLLAVFLSVFHSSRVSMRTNSTQLLQHVVQEEDSPGMMHPGKGTGTGKGDGGGGVQMPFFVVEIFSDSSSRFYGGTYYAMDDTETMQQIVDACLAENEDSGVLSQYNLRYLKSETSLGTRIGFVDISVEKATLNSLLVNSLQIGAAAIAVFFFFSYLFSGLATRPVEKAWLEQRRFISDASHELKTPLTVILSSADLLSEDLGEQSRETQYVDNIRSEGERMKKLVEGMLTLARSDTMQQKPALEALDLSDLTMDAALLFEPVVYEKGLELTYQVDEGVQVEGDRDKLRQIIGILLDNAIKYSPQGEKIALTLTKEEKHVRLQVENGGEPIPPEQLSHLFERFYRADSSRTDTTGFGLGLSIAQTIAQEHKGTIKAESDRRSTRFIVTLPLHHAAH